MSRELGVRYVVEGSVRRDVNQVRITVQLIDAMTGGHVWSERYDRELQGLFALQDEVRQKIVLALKVKLTPEDKSVFSCFLPTAWRPMITFSRARALFTLHQRREYPGPADV